MSPVVADMSVSLDGFVAGEDDGVEGVFNWYANSQPQPGPDEPEGDEAIKVAVGMRNELGALVYGRRTFEIAHGWGGAHPTGAPVIVVSYSVPDGWPRPDGRVRFAAGIDEALEMARLIAADKIIAIATPTIVQQLLDRGQLDGVRLNLVPLLLGGGTRYFSKLTAAPIDLEGPIWSQGTVSPTCTTRFDDDRASRCGQHPPHGLPGERPRGLPRLLRRPRLPTDRACWHRRG